MDLQLLMRLYGRDGRSEWLDMVRITLDRMAAGGINDHLAGGFARYSVDARWLVPHFEKMLYDNALLARTYAEAFLATGDSEYARVARETLDYILTDMTDPAGGFYSAEDADSEGEEGLFYTWKSEEIREVLGEDDGDLMCDVYNVSPLGNFEGRNILHLPKTLAIKAKLLGEEPVEFTHRIAKLRKKLLTARAHRVRPGRDDKVLVGWNGLAIDAFAYAGAALGEPRFTVAAKNAADFLLANLRTPEGRLLHTWRRGVAKLAGYVDDYAALANGLVTLYEATFEERYITAAVELVDAMLAHFGSENGVLCFTADDHETLLTRSQDLTDNATPGGNSLAATVLVRLGLLTANDAYLTAADRIFAAAAPLMERASMATGQMLLALDLRLGPTPELIFCGDGARDLALQRQRHYEPRRVIACRPGVGPAAAQLDANFAGKPTSGEATLYECQQGSCAAPITGAAAIQKKRGRG